MSEANRQSVVSSRWRFAVVLAAGLKDVEEGDGTFLSTKEWKYSGFFNRVKQSVGTHWNPNRVLRTRDPLEALADLHGRGLQHLFLEGGPTLAAAFLRAGLVDEAVGYVAPMLLGSGRSAVDDLGITTIADALHFRLTDVTTLGDGPEANVRLTMSPNTQEVA